MSYHDEDADRHLLRVHGADDGEDDEGGEEVVGLVVEQVLRDAVQPPLLVVQVRNLHVHVLFSEVGL